MTLVMTEVSSYGVAMAADSAVTFSNGRVYIGAQKLLPVHIINAGLSIWGQGCVKEKDADIWVQNFIQNDVRNEMTLLNMAKILADKLNNEFGGVIGNRMGIHVGGFDEKDGVRGPAFYHIHNGNFHYKIGNGNIDLVPGEDPPIREFRVHEDNPPQIYTNNNYPIPTRNGDFSIFAILYDQLNPILNNIQKSAGFNFPSPSNLESRGEFLRFWINITSELYRLSDFRKRVLIQPAAAGDASIGGPISVLTISPEGIQSFYTK